jgi:hypothetical protein
MYTVGFTTQMDLNTHIHTHTHTHIHTHTCRNGQKNRIQVLQAKDFLSNLSRSINRGV